MKITIKNVTNMTAYSNIPEGDNKFVLKFGEPDVWRSNGNKRYVIYFNFSNKEQSEIKVEITREPLTMENTFVTGLDIVNGIKLDTDWTLEYGTYKSTSKNNFLINRFKKHEDLYIYGFPKLK